MKNSPINSTTVGELADATSLRCDFDLQQMGFSINN